MCRFFTVFFFFFLLIPAYSNENSYTYNLIVQKNVPLEEAQIFARAFLKEGLFNSLLQQKELSRLVRLAGHSLYDAKALLLKSLKIDYVDSLDDPQYVDDESYIYKAVAFFNEEEYLKNIQKDMKKSFFLFRLSEIEIGYNESLAKVKELLYFDEAYSGYEVRAKYRHYTIDTKEIKELLTKEAEHLQMLDMLTSLFMNYYTDIWEKPEEIRLMLDEYNHFIDNSLVLSNTLAELYLQVDRPQRAFVLLEKAEKRNLYTSYLKILSSLKLGQLYLAKEDLKQVLRNLESQHPLYGRLSVLEGTIAEYEQDIESMCKAYEKACVYDICAPYFRVQSLCTK